MAGDGYWERVQQQRLSRRRTLAGALAGSAGLAALAAACGSSKSSSQPASGGSAASSSGAAGSPAAKQPRRGGTFNHTSSQIEIGDPPDPQTSTPLKGEGLHLTYEGVVGYNTAFETVPELAQKWEQPDQSTYVFHVQPGVKWQNKGGTNGRAFVADDIVYSLNRARSNDPNFTSRTLLDSVDQITAVDPATVKMTAKAPDAALVAKLSGDSLLMMAKEVVDKAGKFATADVVVGTGAFILQDFKEQVGAQFVRNPDYWRQGQPYLDAVNTHYFAQGPGDPNAWAAFLAGQLEHTVAPGTEVKGYISKQPQGYQPLYFGDTTEWELTPNTKAKPMDDARITRALRLLCDHEEFKQTWAVQNYGRGADGSYLPLSLTTWDFTQDEYKQFPDWKQPKDDAVKQAMDLLSAAGYSKSNPLKFELAATSTYPIVAPLLQGQWNRLGQGVVQTDIKVYETAIYQQVRAKRDYVYGAFSNAASFSEVDTNLTQLYTSGASRNYWNYADPKLDDMINKQRVIFDDTQRKAAVKAILKYMLDNFPGAIFTQRYFFNAIKPNVRNFNPKFWLHGAQYRQVWLDA